VPAEDELAAGHDECGNTAHYEHRQAVHLTHAAGKPVPHLGRRRWHQVSAGGPQGLRLEIRTRRYSSLSGRDRHSFSHRGRRAMRQLVPGVVQDPMLSGIKR
jgi:hypothetical protein